MANPLVCLCLGILFVGTSTNAGNPIIPVTSSNECARYDPSRYPNGGGLADGFFASTWYTRPNSNMMYWTSGNNQVPGPLSYDMAADFCKNGNEPVAPFNPMKATLASIHDLAELEFAFCIEPTVKHWIGMTINWTHTRTAKKGEQRYLHSVIEENGQQWEDMSKVDYGMVNKPYPGLPWGFRQPDNKFTSMLRRDYDQALRDKRTISKDGFFGRKNSRACVEMGEFVIPGGGFEREPFPDLRPVKSKRDSRPDNVVHSNKGTNQGVSTQAPMRRDRNGNAPIHLPSMFQSGWLDQNCSLPRRFICKKCTQNYIGVNCDIVLPPKITIENSITEVAQGAPFDVAFPNSAGDIKYCTIANLDGSGLSDVMFNTTARKCFFTGPAKFYPAFGYCSTGPYEVKAMNEGGSDLHQNVYIKITQVRYVNRPGQPLFDRLEVGSVPFPPCILTDVNGRLITAAPIDDASS